MKFEPTLHFLSNGIPVFLDPMDLETVNFKVAFSTGARDEKTEEYGITHFCEHMMNKGTHRFENQKIIDEYLDCNAGTKNAYTGDSVLAFHGRILGDNLNLLIDLLGDQIQNSLFLPEKIETERKVISDELRRYMDSPSEQLLSFTLQKLFNGTLGSAIKIIGTFENIANFSHDQMLEFLSRRLSAKNCIIGISGKIKDSKKTLEYLEKAFGFLQPFDVLENDEIAYNPSVVHNKKSENKNVKLRIYFPNIWNFSYENRLKRMSVGKFEHFISKELYEILRRENGLVYGFNMTNVGNEKFQLNGFSTETAVENLEKVVSLIAKNSYKLYHEKKISEDDLKRYILKNKLGDADWLESAGRRCDKLIGFYRDYKRVYDFKETIKMSESITVKDVIENTRGYFDGAMSIITQGPEFDIDLRKVWEDNFK